MSKTTATEYFKSPNIKNRIVLLTIGGCFNGGGGRDGSCIGFWNQSATFRIFSPHNYAKLMFSVITYMATSKLLIGDFTLQAGFN